MARFSLRSALAAGVFLTLLAPCAFAQPKKVVIDPNQRKGAPLPVTARGGEFVPVPEQPGYVRLDAPLYPVPRPNIPHQVGATLITNQALAPHEMLYTHSYRALYPPFYYRVKGHWWGAFGWSWAHDRWELMGTEVEVNYRSEIPLSYRNPFAGLFD